MSEADSVVTGSMIRAPRAGAIAGILFCILFVTSIVMIRVAVPPSPLEGGEWLEGRVRQVDVAVNLLPISGLAFLWFIGVLRDHLGPREDKFFATVFFGSGLLFVAMLFTAAALSSAVIMAYQSLPDQVRGTGVYGFGRILAYQIMNVYVAKMGAVFMISTSTLSVRGGIFPRPLAILGYALALVLFFGATRLVWAPLLFPLWVMLVSAHILRSNLRARQA